MDVKRDQWMRAAMADDTVVVELLLGLKHQSHASSSSSSPMKSPAPLFVRWGIRRQRSRFSNRCDGGVTVVKKEKGTGSGEYNTTRFSPTTPLSWSGGAGSSSQFAATAADGGFEESSRPSSSFSPPSASRSKSSIVTNEFSSGAINKRLKRKKTFAELKEEESSLLSERVHLTEKITTLRGTVKEQNVRNVNFKRLKHDLALQAKKTSFQQYQSGFSLYNRTASVDVRKKQRSNTSSQDSGFMLPDLNMTPSEDDLYRTS